MLRTLTRNRPCVRRLSSSASVGSGVSEDYKLNAKPLSSMPGPRGLPYFGTYFNYKFGKWPVTDYHNVLLDLFKTYGPLVREERCGETVIHVFDPEYARVIFQADGRMPYIKPLMETTQVYREQREMSPGLGNTNGELWQRIRTAVTPFLMRPERLAEAALSTVDKVATEAVNWFAKLNENDGSVTDLEKRIPLWQMESGTRVVANYRLGFFEGNTANGYRLYEGNRNVFQLTSRLKFSMPVYRYFPSLCPSFKKLSIEEDVVFGAGQRWLDKAWEQYNEAVKSNPEKAANDWPVLHYFAQRAELSKAERDILCLGMMFDGLSTTTPTVLGLLYCLANNPSAQEKAAEEAAAALKMANGSLNYDILASHLTYIRACIKEATRMYTITTDISRIPQRDLIVGGYFFPAGTIVEINTHSLFHDKSQIPSPPNPDTYAPERWLRSDSTAEPKCQPHPFLVLPFGHGARMCAGRRFAEMEMMTLVTRLLSRFQMKWTGDSTLRQTYETLLYPKGVLSLKLERRATGN